MRTVVAFPAPVDFAQQVALAFHERAALEAFVTTFVYRSDSYAGRLLEKLGAHSLTQQLARRSCHALPHSRVETEPFLEVVRVLAAKIRRDSVLDDRIWDFEVRRFTKNLARRLHRGSEAVYAYEYTALEAFEYAGERRIARILDFPSLNSREFEHQKREQRRRYPELATPEDAYFDSLFEERQARRDREMRLADVIVTNSTVSRRSHIAGGADPMRTFAVPYGAPPPLDSIRPRAMRSKLRAVWAGSFSVRKGAHLLVEAWRSLGPQPGATLDAYGPIAVPQRLLRPTLPEVTFHGSVVRKQLFRAFENADVLVFPTLSDGFGMVVTEAFAQGLPVITTNKAGASDLVQHQKNGLIINDDSSESIAEALEWCLSNRDALLEMRSEALSTATRWQWADYRRALIETVDLGLTRAGFAPYF